MGNRHGNKKLALAVRARMARTGETYQRALAALVTERWRDEATDLLAIEIFGVHAAIATFSIAGRLVCMLLSNAHCRRPFPDNPILALGMAGPRAVH